MVTALDDRLGSLLGDTERALRTWLPGQRWFGSPRVDQVRLRVLTRFADQLAWGGPAGLLTVAEVRTGGEVARYGLPLGVRSPAAPLAGVVPIFSTGELAVYDATADDVLTAELLALVGTGAVRGRVRFTPKRRAGLALVPRRGLTGRAVGATSVVLGERYLLKVTRRLGPPDSGLHQALDAAGSPHVAPLLGSVDAELDGAPVTLATLQSYYADALDGRRLAAHGRVDFALEAAALGRAVASVHSVLLDRFGSSGAGQRVLGELCLSRVLRTPTRWLVVPPTAPPVIGSPQRDVAELLRSIDEAGTPEWSARVGEAFRAGYGGAR
ncbi:hypothetical protein M8542_31560 [Amycolatopsis sp. OK19-0408]|uniref:Maltokinase N-terminal cap domain-containing protein n=1 Tax=Amycolatopsis iheyensis TaxID=2945988 RepID=A0A9X2NGG3_9PSEU|nr:hypothetical protein [Amycolatopsis iheyensis]MCR6487377.1 hypothetical protein [Amycolatopsis iheyensis]